MSGTELERATVPALPELGQSDGGLLPSLEEWGIVVAIANNIAQTEFVPKDLRNRGPAVVACILKGRELGLPPMAALSGIAIIDGRPALYGQTMLALLIDNGVEILEEESTAERAFIRAQRGGRITSVEWTFEEAAQIRGKDGKALVDGANWRNYPADMLYWRCVGRLARRLAPDVLAGVGLTVEEARDLKAIDVAGEEVEEPVVAPEVAIPAVAGAAEPELAEPTQAADGRPPLDLGNYDELDAAAIKEKLPLLAQRPGGAELLARIHGYEGSHRGRKTILNLIERLIGGDAAAPGPEDEPEEPAEVPVGASERPQEAAPAPFQAPVAPEPAEAFPRLRFVMPTGEELGTYELNDVPEEDELTELGFALPKPAEGKPVWSEPDAQGVRTIVLEPLVVLETETEQPAPAEKSEEERDLIGKISEACGLVVARYPDQTAWQLDTLVAKCSESWRPSGPPLTSLADFTLADLQRLWDLIPEGVRAEIEA